MTKSILLKTQHVVSTVLTTRQGIASVSKIQDHVEGLAGKVSTNANFEPERDFVVNSIRTVDGRRKLVVLAGTISFAEAKAFNGFASVDIIWLTDGAEPAAIADAFELELVRN